MRIRGRNMAYIKDKELVMSLQKKAVSDKSVANFLLKLPDMSEEEANKTLSEYEAKENEVNNFLEFLNKDELEAIDGYNKGLKLLPNSSLSVEDKEKYAKVLSFISAEEQKHSRWLVDLKNGKADEVLKEIEKEG
jgi:rubrerythrin